MPYTTEQLDQLYAGLQENPITNPVIPNLNPIQKEINMATTSPNGKIGIQKVKYTDDAEPFFVPNNLKLQQIPQAAEALRYAKAGVPDATFDTPPEMHILQDINRFNAEGLTGPNDIGLTKKALNAASFPYIAPQGAPTESMNRLSGVLPHELVHFLVLNNYRKQGFSNTNEYAKSLFQSMSPYTPMYGHDAGNRHDNFDEELANRIAMPYADAQVIGQKAAPLIFQANEDPIKSGVDAPRTKWDEALSTIKALTT